MIGINHKNLPRNFVNSYITYQYDVVLVFDKTEDYDSIFLSFFNRVTANNRNYIGHEEHEDEIVIFFRVPDIWKDDFDTFIKGKYSKFSNDYKIIITRFFGNWTEKDPNKVSDYNIINPEKFKMKQLADKLGVSLSLIEEVGEVFSAPDMENEIYRPIDELIVVNDGFKE